MTRGASRSDLGVQGALPDRGRDGLRRTQTTLAEVGVPGDRHHREQRRSCSQHSAGRAVERHGPPDGGGEPCQPPWVLGMVVIGSETTVCSLLVLLGPHWLLIGRHPSAGAQLKDVASCWGSVKFAFKAGAWYMALGSRAAFSYSSCSWSPLFQLLFFIGEVSFSLIPGLFSSNSVWVR